MECSDTCVLSTTQKERQSMVHNPGGVNKVSWLAFDALALGKEEEVEERN